VPQGLGQRLDSALDVLGKILGSGPVSANAQIQVLPSSANRVLTTGGWAGPLSVDLGSLPPGDYDVAVRSQDAARDPNLPPLPPQIWVALQVVAPAPKLLVDANRDGTITDGETSTTTAPWRFWVNDDNDFGDTGGSDIPLGDFDAAARNGADSQVNGRRDLVDFFPVFLDIKQVLTSFPPASVVGDSGFTYKLKQAEGAVGIVWTKLTRAEAQTVQTHDWGNKFAAYGINPVQLNASIEGAKVTGVTAFGIDLFALCPDFHPAVFSGNGGILLVEARAATTAPLVLTVEKNGVVVAQTELPLSIGPVEDMYRRINLRDGADAPTGLAGDLAVRNSDLGKPTSLSEPTNFPDSLTNGKWFVFVVGSNVGGQRMRGWQSEVFKRMYLSQSKARFVGVSWYGDPYSDGNDLVYDYHSAARNAFTTAPVLTAKLNALAGTKTIAGHSAAALIISSAVADHGLSVSSACLIDAAMSRESFDGSSADDITGMVPAAWRDYPASLWAAHWYEAFNGGTDARATLTWRNRFTGAAGVVHNFYSSTEEVLARYDGTVNGSIIENMRAPGSFAWVIQEKAKGNKLNILSVVHAGSDYGGWGFNLKDPILDTDPVYWKWNSAYLARAVKRPGELGTMSDALLRRQPLFEPGWGVVAGIERMSPPNSDPANYIGPSWIFSLYGATAGNTIAADPVKRSQILNEAIPALSLAVGANPLAFSTLPSTRQYNMPAEFATAAQWPSVRGVNNTTGVAVPNWHHSDMREVAYLYLARFYVKLSALTNQ
jgi:hypothetical protein